MSFRDYDGWADDIDEADDNGGVSGNGGMYDEAYDDAPMTDGEYEALKDEYARPREAMGEGLSPEHGLDRHDDTEICPMNEHANDTKSGGGFEAAANDTAWMGGPWDDARAVLMQVLRGETPFVDDSVRDSLSDVIAAMDRLREAAGIVTDLSGIIAERDQRLAEALRDSIDLASIERRQLALVADVDDLRTRLRSHYLRSA